MNTHYKKLILSALFTAIISVCAQIILPLPSGIPITLQTFAVGVCGYLLGVKYSSFCVVGYLLLGFFGAPIFSGFSAGPAVLFGKSGGFLFGFILLAVFCGIATNYKLKWIKLLLGIIGVLFTHLLGCVQFSIVFQTNLFSAFLISSLPFIIKDIISIIAALVLSEIIKRKSIMRSL